MLARCDRDCLKILLVAAVFGLLLVAVPAAGAEPVAPPCQTATESLAAGPVIVQGWVIDHRERPVDATRTSTGLRIDAISAAGAVVSAQVAEDGFFRLVLQPDVWDFSMQLPPEWDSIVPVASRGGLSATGCTPLASQKSPYLVVFKIRRLVDVTVTSTPLTPPQVTVYVDPYLASETSSAIVLKNRGK